MPIGIERLNSRHLQPSSQIVFIKPLAGSDADFARDFLERIAAICHPIMKSNHLSIMTLEEHEANTEFIGRNFNAGEIIQLVLKSYRTGQWLSFKTVQMIMMHELAHCAQMNHSRAFWKVRNDYAAELRGLWQKNYTGDGLWGRGQTLLSGRYDTGRRAEEDLLPENLCGGAYRSSRRRKRKRGPAATDKKPEPFAERQQRRVAKKFGVAGQTLGGDQETRVKLEKGQSVKAKPKVANSSRGRELRVAAALARFGQQEEDTLDDAKPKEDLKKDQSKLSSDTEDDSENSDVESVLKDHKGQRIQDQEGRDMIRVCGTEDEDDEAVKQERDELQGLNGAESSDPSHTNVVKPIAAVRGSDPHDQSTIATASSTRDQPLSVIEPSETQSEQVCSPICSMGNAAGSALCVACSHVLDVSLIANHWRCQKETCKESDYVNAGDFGRSGVCGAHKASDPPE
ncbi:uncharacterized protein KY384_002596 [Bacidia gigantensis]|uniref:uncharacterized protein n=1 Tax=Bacidia gigantensis TaxID=2732470 RepID=UPI001D05081B|nr:uncharacterized protein KY384_002596 [Bacidia gigantensis]KAG8532719.1 hypothetical protein KY384_002596 [Bacidia gigantensis]